MTTLSVVIPAYNEEDGIAEIMQRVLSIRPNLLPEGVDGFELLVVDDGSKDRTAEIAGQFAANDRDVKVISHPKNKGYGAALKTGFGMATGELVGFLDADGTYPPECFPELCRSALSGHDMVVGSRMAGADSKMPLTRRIGNLFFANLVSLLGRYRITDSASGMRVFKREVLSHLYPLPDGLNLTPVMSARAIHESLKVAEVPIPYSERVGRSKLSVVRDGYVFLHSIVWTVMSYNPVRILGLLGLGGVLFAGLVGLWLVISRLSGITQLSPWGVAALFAAIVAAVTGMSIFALGATFNYLIMLFYKRPIRQGLFGRPLFNPPLEHHFGWMGVLGVGVGLALAAVSLWLGSQGWGIERLWLYLSGSAGMILLGAQLSMYWVLMRILEELSQREQLISRDFGNVERRP